MNRKNELEDHGLALMIKERSRLPKESWPRQNYPIENSLKIKRVYQKETINTTCWAYMKRLREHDNSKKTYDIDPYAEVYTFRENIYGILTESADGAGDAWMFLIIGPQKAMLIDTSFGIGNLKGLVEQLANGKEIIVVNTHGHYDHAYGNCQFDKVFCHEYEVPLLEKQDEHIWDYLFEEGSGRGIWADFDRHDIVPFKKYEIIGCPDGHIFDLGSGYEVELVFLGGHTAGHAGFLDKQARIFFAGDDVVSMRVSVNGPRDNMPYGDYASVNTLYENLNKMVSRMHEYDHVFSSHFVTDLENTAIQAMADSCASIIEDPFENYHFSKGSGDGKRYFRYVEGLGLICYSAKAIRQ